MRERPILFSSPLVRAILEGRKTQTRRLMRPQPTPNPVVQSLPSGDIMWSHPDVAVGEFAEHVFGSCAVSLCKKPYAQVGDRLWVREAFYLDTCPEGPLPKLVPPYDLDRRDLYYRADGDCCDQIPECSCAEVGKPNWRPSIHMPRWASRITLEVTSVRVERVQDISEHDAGAEGIRSVTKDGTVSKFCVYDRGDHSSVRWADMPRTAVECFRSLWDSINGRRAPWSSNPWVWVIEFERMESDISNRKAS